MLRLLALKSRAHERWVVWYANSKPIEECVKDYVRIAADVGNLFANTKYTALYMLKENKKLMGQHSQSLSKYALP